MEEKMIEMLLQLQLDIRKTNENINNGMDRLENRMSSLEGKVDGLEVRIGNLEDKVDGLEVRIGNVENRLESLENKVEEVDVRLGSLEDKVDGFEKRMDNLVQDISNELVEAVKVIDVKLEDYKKDQKVMEDIAAKNLLEVEKLKRFIVNL